MTRLPSDPHLFLVFGGTGDLMERKLLPALFSLHREGKTAPRSAVLGVARSRDLETGAYRRWAAKALAKAGFQGDFSAWLQRLHYLPLGEGAEEDFQRLARRVEELDREGPLEGNRVLYLALPPGAFPGVVKGLSQVGLNRSSGWTRLVVEKPFGRDLTSARQLNRSIHACFQEKQVYRIDHYLGKETVQNLLVFRFANPIFESLWNRDRVDHVQITVAEQVGVEGRGAYYERAGALRDMVQNHLTQLLSLTAMEVPAAWEADSIRDEKVKVLRSIAPIAPQDVVLGQYQRGRLNGKTVRGYREEAEVDPQSETETFAALRLRIANWRWQGVPFFLRTGKRLSRRLTQIRVHFRCAPVSLFHPFEQCRLHSNALIITLQPDEGFDLLFEVKTPREEMAVQTQRLHFRYEEVFGPLVEAYQTLLLDIVTGDQTLFVRADEVEAAWRLYTPLLEGNRTVYPYEAGSWGPLEAERLLEGEGRRWETLWEEGGKS